MVHSSSTAINISHRVLDLAVLSTLSLFAADRLIPKELAIVLAVYCSFIMMAVFSAFHMYPCRRKTGVIPQVPRLAAAWLAVLVVFNLIVILMGDPEQHVVRMPFGSFSSAGFNFWALLVFGGLATARVATHLVLEIVRSRAQKPQTAIIIGAGTIGRKLAQYLCENRSTGISILGFFDDELPTDTAVKSGSTFLGKVIGPFDSCHDSMANIKADLVFLASPKPAEHKIVQDAGRLANSGHSVLIVQNLSGSGVKNSRTRKFGELQVMDFNLFPVWKRLFDIVFSLAVVAITFPLWLTIMLAIKVEDGGPVFFRHQRVMAGGRRFDCLKFRSMQPNAQHRIEHVLEQDPLLRQEWEKHYKLQNDPRVTRVGRLLRRFRLDELPQFLNVLSGEMSVVGARPVVLEELEKFYGETTLAYYATKPGITGLWQVSTQGSVMDYAGRVRLDRWYILNYTIWMDLKIILKTIWRIAFV